MFCPAYFHLGPRLSAFRCFCCPKVWDNAYFVDLLEYDWVQEDSPGGAIQWIPVLKEDATETEVPDIIMLTSDVALLEVRSCEAVFVLCWIMCCGFSKLPRPSLHRGLCTDESLSDRNLAPCC